MNALFQPGRIGALALRNRLVMASMTTRLADPDGFATDPQIAYYAARARGGVGLVTVEMASPERAGRHRFRELGISDDRFLPGLRRIARTIKAEGAAAAIQLGHGGGHTSMRITGERPVAPSAIPHPLFEVVQETVVPEAMSAARIEAVTLAYVAAAARAAEAGFDAVEIHAAHGYLISQFLCPAENHRTDEYGGSLENRARFGLDILRRMVAALPGLPVIFRFDSDDFFPGGLVPDEAEQVGIWAAQAGAAALHVTGGHYRSLPSAEQMIPPMAYRPGGFVPFAARLRSRVRVPVIVVGRLGEPGLARRVVEQGRADFIALARPLLADPDWPAKVAARRTPRPCLACNTCVNQMRAGSQLGCLVNPAAGRETAWNAAPRATGERIAVIGAGPAGLTYALAVAPANQVTLFERAAQPGGAFRLAGLAPTFQEVEAAPDTLRGYAAAMVQACREAGVAVRFGADAWRGDALAGFDRIVIASGARYRFGLGPLVALLLRLGLGRIWPLRRLMASPRLRGWFYTRARRAIAPRSMPGAAITVEVIGDAARPGKSDAAIESAFAAAFGEAADAPGTHSGVPPAPSKPPLASRTHTGEFA